MYDFKRDIHEPPKIIPCGTGDAASSTATLCNGKTLGGALAAVGTANLLPQRGS